MRTRALYYVTLLLLLSALIVTAASGAIIRVKPTGSDANDGSSWALAKQTVGGAITAAASGDEIWVAAGTYTGALTMKNGVALYGGFAGTESARTDRNYATNISILDGQQASCVVTIPSTCTSSTVIDGLKISNGKSTSGGGIYCDGSSPTIANCNITNNTAANGSGGGIACIGGSAASISGCTITANHAKGSNTVMGTSISGSGGNGGGIYCNSSSPTITNCTITYNDCNSFGSTAVTGPTCDQGRNVGCGGGILCSGNSSATITGCTISNNQANGYGTSVFDNGSWYYPGIGGDGGGVFAEGGTDVPGCSLSLTSSTISNNQASGWILYSAAGGGYGGGVCAFGTYSSTTIKSCTVASNQARWGGGLELGGPATVQNNQISSNTAAAAIYSSGMYYAAFGGYGGGIHCNSTSATIAVNMITNNAARTSYTGSGGTTKYAGAGGALYLYSGTTNVYNNTITGSTAGDDSSVSFGDYAVFVNNIIASNSGGVNVYSPSTFTFRNNCVSQNTSYNFSGMTDPTGTSGNIGDNPRLSGSNLGADSLCVDAGDDSVVQAGWSDYYGHARIYGAHVDIGADEFEGTPNPAVAMPIFTPYGGQVTTTMPIVITCKTPGATIRYTTNGANPNTNSTIIASGGSITIAGACTVKARAWKTGASTSDITSAAYTIGVQVQPVVITPAGGNCDGGFQLQMTCATTSATIYYTTDGTEPTTSSKYYDSYSRPWVRQSMTIKAKAFLTSYIPSDTNTQVYTVRSPRIVRVNASAPGVTQDGTSWTTAYTSLVSAASAAVIGDEFWVAGGTYAGNVKPPSGTSIYGGFAGTETARDQRNASANEAIVDRGTGYGYGIDVEGTTKSGLVTTIDGVTVRGGRSYAAIYITGDTAVVSNCKITGAYGTGINCVSGLSATITGNQITGNYYATSGYYYYGIACQCDSMVVTDNTISNNTTAGIECKSGTATISNNILSGNTGQMAAIHCYSVSGSVLCNDIRNNTVGIYCEYGGPVTIANNVLAGNTYSSLSSTGGIRIDYGCTANITNDTLTGNTATATRGAILCATSSNVTITNCIIYNNVQGGIYAYTGATVNVYKSCVFGNTAGDYNNMTVPPAGNGNISVSPSFVSSTDYHLSGTSPCTNAGDNTAIQPGWTDLDGKTRIISQTVDMGAYEYGTVDPSLSTLAQAKADAGTSRIKTSGAVTVANSTGSYFYIEDPLRATGMRAKWTGTMPPTNKITTVTGYTKVDDTTGERYIDADSVSSGTDSTPAPVVMTCAALGGTAFGSQAGILNAKGLSSIGLLVKVYGQVTQVDPGGAYFYIDDGSNLWDLSTTGGVSNTGVRVSFDGRPYAGQYVVVTGISSCFKSGGNIERCILVQQASDIRQITP